jgi:hypothetical protein
MKDVFEGVYSSTALVDAALLLLLLVMIIIIIIMILIPLCRFGINETMHTV